MPKEAFWVNFDIEEEGGGGKNTKAGTVFRKGETLPSVETVGGAAIGVGNAKVVKLEAESIEEAIKIAGEAYGPRNGVGGACKFSNWEFKGQ